MIKKSSLKKKSSKKKNGWLFLIKDLNIVVKISAFLSLVLILWALYSVYIVKADDSFNPITYFQGFEEPSIAVNGPDGETLNTYSWFPNNLTSPTNPVVIQTTAIKQAVSGFNGILASSGNFYGIVSKQSSYSKFSDKCEAGGPTERWLTEIDVYLDTTWNLGKGFDYSIETKEINPDNSDKKRNFVFHVTKDTSTKKLLIGASTDTATIPKEDLENGLFYEVKKTGWYTLRSKLGSVENTLVVDMVILDSTKKVVWQNSISKNDMSYDVASLSWNCLAEFPALSDGNTSTNPDGTVKMNGFDLPIDNHKLILYKNITTIGPPTSKDQCYNDGWKIFDWQTFTEPTFKNQGDCISFVENSN